MRLNRHLRQAGAGSSLGHQQDQDDGKPRSTESTTRLSSTRSIHATVSYSGFPGTKWVDVVDFASGSGTFQPTFSRFNSYTIVIR